VNDDLVLGPFGGPGGWPEGARRLGIREVGIELDATACATRRTAGHRTIRADVAAFPVEQLAGKTWGQTHSPPCVVFSAAGNRAGNAVTAILAEGIRDALAGRKTRALRRREMAHALRCSTWGGDTPGLRCDQIPGSDWLWDRDKQDSWKRALVARRGTRPGLMRTSTSSGRHPTRAQRSAKIQAAVRSASLVIEPARFIAAGKPEWTAMEQVPSVLPLWKVYAEELEKLGYSAWHGILNAADYGIIAPCPLHATSFPNVNADCVGPYSQYETALVSALAHVTTEPSEKTLLLAATVAARWASRIRRAFAGAATCAAREQALIALAESVGPIILPGQADVEWTSEATSGFGLTPATVASIASLLSSFLGGLSPEEKSCITSMKTRQTIVHLISRSIAATLITGPGTGPESRTAGCGLCVDLSVPQTRQRAILIASRVRKVSRPTPTHYDPRKGDQLFGRPWTSMAEALGWGATARPAPTATAGGTSTGGAEPFGHRDRDALEAERDAGRWALRIDNQTQATVRGIDEPAPTIKTGHSFSSEARWVLRRERSAGRAEHDATRDRPLDVPAPTVSGGGEGRMSWVLHTNRDQRPDGTRQTADPLTAPALTAKSGGQWIVKGFRNNNNNNNNNNACERSIDEPAGTLFFGQRSNWAAWVTERSATSVQGDPILGRPGHKDRDKGESQFEQDSVRITVEEAAILQSFPADYPFQGTRTARFRQVGDAIPPRLAAHVLSMATGIPLVLASEAAA